MGLAAILVFSGCPLERAARLPDADAVAESYGPTARVELRGNVIEVVVPLAEEMLRSPLWARSGPYFYVFSTPTRIFFEEYPDLAAVRVTTVDPRGDEVSSAMLRRGTLGPARWHDGLAIRSVAQTEGTERPGTVQRLVRFGEEHTDYTYNPRYTEWQ
jgi:hypothetical protein